MLITIPYLEAINEINMAERAVDRQGSNADALLRLSQAYDAAEAAWEDLAPQIQYWMSPPPERPASVIRDDADAESTLDAFQPDVAATRNWASAKSTPSSRHLCARSTSHRHIAPLPLSRIRQ